MDLNEEQLIAIIAGGLKPPPRCGHFVTCSTLTFNRTDPGEPGGAWMELDVWLDGATVMAALEGDEGEAVATLEDPELMDKLQAVVDEGMR